jgi:hypothetical protein
MSQAVAKFCVLGGDENEAHKELIVNITKCPLCCDPLLCDVVGIRGKSSDMFVLIF